MKRFIINSKSRQLLADTITPVSIYLRLRDVYPNSILLESSDYNGNENSYSFICLKPLAHFEIDNGIITELFPDGSGNMTEVTDRNTFTDRFSSFIGSFSQSATIQEIPVNGLFGYISYDAVEHFEKIKFKPEKIDEYKIPEVRYNLYKYIIAINHFQNVLQIIENQIDDDPGEIEMIETLLNSRNFAM